MEDSHHPQEPTSPNNYSNDGQVIITGGSSSSGSRNEPVRSRWTPKPEQILILESIFNSGMVNPPKEETIKIRKVLEKFGAVGDANVFYWFQNRRSRSRRRQRQMQAAACSTLLSNAATVPPLSPPQMMPPSQQQLVLMNTTTSIASSSSSTNPMITSSHNHQGFVNFAGGDVGFSEIDPQNPCSSSIFQPCHALQFHQSGGGGGGGGEGMNVITVFINGVETEVQRGPVDMKGMFGEDVVLVHSSGVPVPLNHYGFSLHSLQHGESYFLVPRPI